MATDNSPVVTEEKLLYFYNTYLKPYINAESGGHAIKNENDLLPLEQRETMVLNTPLMGSDDSTNEATVLDVDTNVDLSVIHAPGIAGNVEGHIYSTEEQVVGKWIDGKPIYEKTVQLTTPSNGQPGAIYTYDSTFNILFYDGYVVSSDGTKFQINIHYPNTFDFIIYDYAPGNKIYCIASRNSEQNATLFLVIQYTKTSDTV
jgi:hypothetical protein